MPRKHYDWDIGNAPPKIAKHSRAKHDVMRDYVTKYISVLTADPRIDTLRLTLVDGFAGGGLFTDDISGGEVLGSPLMLLNTITAAEQIAQARRTKNFRIDARFVFVEKRAATVEFLKKTLTDRGYKNQIGDTIHVLNGEFTSHYDKILSFIRKRSAKTRVIFILDQYGYKDVPFHLLKSIFQHLLNAEVILTFATEWLVDYLAETPKSRATLASFGVELESPLETVKQEQVNSWKLAIQLQLHEQIRKQAGANFYTPFFIRSTEAHRAYWLIHLSGHARARDVMTNLHWEKQNSFEHFGKPGLAMLGYDPAIEVANQHYGHFLFDDIAKDASLEAIRCELPKRLPRLPEKVSFQLLFSQLANDMPADSSMLESVLRQLHLEDEILVYNKDGRIREQGCVIQKNDQIARRAVVQRTFLDF